MQLCFIRLMQQGKLEGVTVVRCLWWKCKQVEFWVAYLLHVVDRPAYLSSIDWIPMRTCFVYDVFEFVIIHQVWILIHACSREAATVLLRNAGEEWPILIKQDFSQRGGIIVENGFQMICTKGSAHLMDQLATTKQWMKQKFSDDTTWLILKLLIMT